MGPQVGQRFTDNERFQAVRVLGSGGMGTVHEVLDRITGERLALKVLDRLEPVELGLFKREFRSLVDLVHPNLVTLRELFSDGRTWYFTMELIEGVPLLDYVWGPELGPGLAEWRRHVHTLLEDTASVPPVGVVRARAQARGDAQAEPEPPAVDEGCEVRVRSVFAQLARGVSALHRAGKLHRDLKPSNILVTRAGHVCILDFGLVLDVAEQPAGLGGEVEPVLGSLAYMSPEQLSGGRLGPASDWYAVGVMLYEALTGVHPWLGDVRRVRRGKADDRPTNPASLDDRLPRDLSELALELLDLQAAHRVSGETTRHRLGVDSVREPTYPSLPATGVQLVGRQAELDVLRNALTKTVAGDQATVLVTGPSGIGKTTLVGHFLAEVLARGGMVLDGRCHEKESVPFNALDPIVDLLTLYLGQLRPQTRSALLPPQLPALVRLFPGLARLLPDGRKALSGPLGGDAASLLRRAFGGLRSLLWNLTSRVPVVLHIDDLQWTDGDSVAGLQYVLRQPNPPPLLVVLTLRSDQETPAIQALLSSVATRDGRTERIELEPLDEQDAALLAAQRLDGGDPDTPRIAREIAAESGGLPVFAIELARHATTRAREGETTGLPTSPTLEEVVRWRAGRLEEAARHLLELLAVAGGPLQQGCALEAAGMGSAGWKALDELTRRQLARVHGRGAEGQVECFHDRIRDAVLAGLRPGQLAPHHRALAEALEGRGAEPEVLYRHSAAAGEVGGTLRYAEAAARKAAEALAFERAVELYGVWLGKAPPAHPDRASVEERQVDALLEAGRAYEAGELCERAARLRQGEDARRLEGKAARAFLESGHLDRGRPLLRRQLEAAGIPLLDSASARAMAGVRARVSTSRLRAVAAKDERPGPERLAAIDACATAAIGLGMSDPMEGALYHSRALLLARKVGAVERYAPLLAAEAAFRVATGKATWDDAEPLFEAAAAHATETGSKRVLGLVALHRGIAAHHAGQWQASLQAAAAARTLLLRSEGGVAWALRTAEVTTVSAGVMLGRLRGALRQFQPLALRARQRDDRWTEVLLRGQVLVHPWLYADGPELAAADIEEALARWPVEAPSLPRLLGARSLAQVALYRGCAAQALELVGQATADVQRSSFKRLAYLGDLLAEVGVRACLASAASDPGDRRALRRAGTAVSRLERRQPRWIEALAAAARAQLTLLRGDTRAAVVGLAVAAEQCEEAGMRLHAAAARWRHGELGAPPLLEEANRWLVDAGVRNPPLLVDMLLPVRPS